MSTIKKVVYEKGFSKPTISDEIKSHTNDSFFVEKLEKAKKTLSKAIFPDHLKK